MRRVLPLLILAAAIPAWAVIQDALTLKLNVPAGTEVKRRVTIDQEIAFGGQNINAKISMDSLLVFGEKSEKGQKVTMSYSNLKAESDQPGIEDAMSGMANAKMDFEVGENASILSAKAEGEAAAMAAQMASAQSGLMGVILPTTPVKVGDKWSTKVDPKAAVPANSEMTIKAEPFNVEHELMAFEDVDGKPHAKIKVTSKSDSVTEMQGMEIANSTKSSTMVWVDVATGLVTKSDGTVETSGSMSFGDIKTTMRMRMDPIKG